MPVNCLTCYRIHKCGDNKYFCPFLGVNPCIRGEHYAKYISKPKPKPVPPLEPAIKIPEYFPVQRRRGIHGEGANIDWARYHNEIFTRIGKGDALAAIARDINVSFGALQYYVKRYR